MTVLDYAVIAAYALGLLAVGRYYAARTQTADDYLLGGRRMNPFMIGLSLFATLTSTLSYLALPGETIKNGPMIFAQLTSFPAVFLIVGWLLIPWIMRQKATSGYELLEARLGVTGRLLGAGMFVALRTLWMASILYATTDKVLAPLLGLDPRWTPLLAAAMGAITIAYTTEGGLRAVVVTDAMQSVIMLAGAIATVALVTARLGGVGAWWPTAWQSHWQEPVFWLHPSARVTFLGAFLNMFVWMTCTAGSDQMALQRYLATRDARAARRSLLVHLIAEVVVLSLLGVVGLAVLGYIRVYPELLQGESLQAAADQLLPRFIVEGLPMGFTGLVIAALLSAAMSSLSSGMNSTSAVVTSDFVGRFRAAALSQAEQIRWARWVSVAVGLLAVLLSTVVPYLAENLLEMCIKVVNLLTAPLFVLFFLALFVPWANAPGALAATAAGVGVAVAIAFFEVFDLGFLWSAPASFLAGAAVGTAVSYLARPRQPAAREPAAAP